MIKDPDDVLPYKFDWSEWLTTGESITAATAVGEGVTVDDVATPDAQTVTVVLSGGVAGTTASVVCHITTSAGYQADQTMSFAILER